MMKSEQRGFTLVEIMLVLALLGMVLAAGWGVFTLAMKSWEVFQIRQEAEAAVRLTSMVITHELDYASFLEIRKENMWPADNNLNTGDRIIYTNVDGDKVFLSEYNGSNLTPSTIIETERCTLELSFKKPEYPVDSKKYLRNSLDYTISAHYKTGNKGLIYSTSSSVMTSNMLQGYGVPVSEKSLYSQDDKTYVSPGDRIRYNTTTSRFVPSTPGSSGTCGL